MRRSKSLGQALKDPYPGFQAARPSLHDCFLLAARPSDCGYLCVEAPRARLLGWNLLAASAFAAAATRYNEEVAALMNPARWFSATRLGLRKNFNEELVGRVACERKYFLSAFLESDPWR